MKRILKTGLLLAFLLLCGVGAAQPPVLIHSHNDYTRTVPFYRINLCKQIQMAEFYIIS